jgi:NADPH:quinone reductase-like Zn-dependent oxidoreductase
LQVVARLANDKGADVGCGGPEVMEIEDVPVPQPPRDDEVLVRVHAASVNPVDYKIRRGRYVGTDKLALTLGRDVSGVVARIGSRVQRLKRGDAPCSRQDRGDARRLSRGSAGSRRVAVRAVAPAQAAP